MVRHSLLFLLISILGISSNSLYSQTVYGYLGQTPPENIPVVFAPGIVTGFVHSPIAISPNGDEICWAIAPTPNDEQIMYSKLENEIWTEPDTADFIKDNTAYSFGVPSFSPDGKKLYFYSNRPGGIGGVDVWYVERTDSGWSKPINAGKPYNTIQNDPTPLFTKAGKAYRFGFTNNDEPLCYQYETDGFSNPTSFSVIVDPGFGPWWSIFISQNEEYLIYAGERSIDNPDLYIRFKNNGEWGSPINMGNRVNTEQWERFPSVSPDGKYLFFNRGDDDTNHVYWVSTTIIDSIKATLTGIREEKGIGKIEDFKLYQNYANPFNPSTVISYQLSAFSTVKLTIYNMLGQKIKTLIDSYQGAGEHSIMWNATDNSNTPVSSGVYFYQLKIENGILQKKMILAR